MISKIKSQVLKHKVPITVFIICALGLFLRFWKIEENVLFTWDQGRDAWTVWEILEGKFPLKGPRTGIGDFYLGPIYFYLLAPFYWLAKMDPMGANYFNITVNIITFPTIFLVAKKIFNTKVALIALIIFALNTHAIVSTKTPWNVTFIPLLSSLLLYSQYQILKGNYKYIAAIAAICGFFFHIHFTAIFLPLILIPTFFLAENKKQIIKWSILSVPLFLVWFIPTIVEDLTHHNYNFFRFKNFIGDYAMGPHIQFLLYRANDAFIQMATVLHFKQLDVLKYTVLPIFAAYIIFKEKNKITQKIGLLFIPWLLVPWFGFTLFKGHVPDYYYLLNLIISIYIVAYLVEKLANIKNIYITAIIVLISTFYLYSNVKIHFLKTLPENLKTQKYKTIMKIDGGQILEYKEGDIESYLYTAWGGKKPKWFHP